MDADNSPPPAAVAASSSSSSRTISEHLAQTIQTLDQLTTIFFFPHDIAQLAIEAVGPEDVTLCYNWIFDNYSNNNEDDDGGGVMDGGGPVVPKEDCPHLDYCVDKGVLDKLRWVCNSDDVDVGASSDGVENNMKEQCCTAAFIANDPSSSAAAADAASNDVGLTKNIFQMKCQHSSLMKCPPSRKRLRSEDCNNNDTTTADDSNNNNNDDDVSRNDSVNSSVVVKTGLLKCDEDYNYHDNNNDDDSNRNKNGCSGKENWLCLQCGVLLCSRYEFGHAKLHYEDTKEVIPSSTTSSSASSASCGLVDEGEGKESQGDMGNEQQQPHQQQQQQQQQKQYGHCIAVSLADLSVWCYECNAYLSHPSLTMLMKRLEDLKFGGDEEEEEGHNHDDNGEQMKKKGGDDDVDDGSNDSNNDEEMTDLDATTNEVATKPAPSDRGMDLFEATKPNATEQSEQNRSASSGSGGISKRKSSQPKKLSMGLEGGDVAISLLSGQSGTTITSENNGTRQSHEDDDSHSDKSGNEDGSGSNGDNNSESSGSSLGSHQAAILATLLQGEQSEAIRAYLSRHESFNTGDMGQCVPMHMPKPPEFPDEMTDFLRSPLCQSICVLAGAGMSVSSGIPDFRSAGVGLYDTIRPELLTASELEQAIIEDDPTLALDKGMFLRNPLPMLELKRDFILGTQTQRWKATLAHRFVELLHTKLGKLTRLYTQNIDGLELQTSIPKEKIVNVHGSMGAAACELCEAEVDFDAFCDKVSSNIKDITGRDEEAPTTSTPITCEACGKPTVKPTIVLFRGSMPQIFHRRTAEDLPDCDLLIIMGTSLQVAPANSLVYRIPPTALRMVMNNEKVGRRLGIMYGEDSIRDVYAQGYTDETCLDLAEKMGWLEDLNEIVDELPESSARLLRQRIEQRAEE